AGAAARPRRNGLRGSAAGRRHDRQGRGGAVNSPRVPIGVCPLLCYPSFIKKEHTMHLGVCHAVTLPGEWEQAIADAGALGFEGIELFVRANTAADLLDHPERVASLRSAAASAGVSFPSLGLIYFGPDFRLYSPDAAV